MKFKVVEKGNPGKPDDKKKQYANAVNTGNLTIRDLTKEIAGHSSLTRGDIEKRVG